jgi:hypothetical protein
MESLSKGEPMEYEDLSELSSQLAGHHHHTEQQFYLSNIQSVLGGKCDEDYEFFVDLIKMNKAAVSGASASHLISANVHSHMDDFNDDDQFADELINPKYLRQMENRNK